jgi:hypothetical protein
MADMREIQAGEGEGLRVHVGRGVIDIDKDGNVLCIRDLRVDVLAGCIVKLAHAEVFERQQACVVHEEVDCAYPGERGWKAAYDMGYNLGKRVGPLGKWLRWLAKPLRA